MVAPSEPGRRVDVRTGLDQPAAVRVAVHHVGDPGRSAALARLLSQAESAPVDAVPVDDCTEPHERQCLVVVAAGARAAVQAVDGVDTSRSPVVVVLPGGMPDATVRLLAAGADDVVTVLDPEVVAGVAWRSVWRRSGEERPRSVIDLTGDERGATATDTDPVDCERILHRVVTALRPLLARHRATVRLLGRFPRLRVDAGQFERVFGEVITNAVIHHPPGRPPEIRIRAQAVTLGRGTVLTVDDSGRGIDEMFHRVVLLPGVRLQPRAAHTEGRAPTGDGLADCVRLVRGWGGEMTLGSSHLGGLSVQIALPAAALAEPALV